MPEDATEYTQCMTNLRYFLDYRAKIFNFCITVNGALLTVCVVHESTPAEALFLSLFALLVSVFSFIAERRSVQLADWFREAAIQLEKQKEYEHITYVHHKAKSSGIGFRRVFQAFYVLILISWIGYIINLLRII